VLLRGGVKTSGDQNGAAKCGRERKRKPTFPDHGTAPKKYCPHQDDNAWLRQTIRHERLFSFQERACEKELAAIAGLQRSRLARAISVTAGIAKSTVLRGEGCSRLSIG
jgi:hypothetical protein